MNHFAFDWGDVLENKPAMWELARSLSAAGFPVSIISWCGSADGPKSEAGRRRISASGIPWQHIVGFGNAPEVTLEVAADGGAEFQIGQAKARCMNEIGATAIFDDNPHICRAVTAAGLQAFQVYRP